MNQDYTTKTKLKPTSLLTISETMKALMSLNKKLFMILNLKMKGSNQSYLVKVLDIMKKALHLKINMQMCNLYKKD